jgi:hypothetical protein
VGRYAVLGALDIERRQRHHRPMFRLGLDDRKLNLQIGNLWLTCSQASPVPPGTDPIDHPQTEYRTPFTTLLHTIPLLAILVLVAVATPLGLLLLLRRTVRPVLIVSPRPTHQL